MRIPSGIHLALVGALLTAAPALAIEDWQLSHGPFVTAADVRAHNKMPLDIAEIDSALALTPPGWPQALERYAFGKNFANHSLAKFADDYNGRLGAHLPVSSGHFGSPSFQNEALFAAIAGTGRFAGASEAERAAFVDTGLVALALNWSRYELGESARKAAANPPNWSLQNGSPKNWNEIFAFYYGPEGRHSVYEAVAALEGGGAINDRLFAVLAEGQADVADGRWAPEAAAKVKTALNEAGMALLADAMRAVDSADEEGLAKARGRIGGYWLAAAEAAAADPEVAAKIEVAFAGKPERGTLQTAAKALAAIKVD